MLTQEIFEQRLERDTQQNRIPEPMLTQWSTSPEFFDYRDDLLQDFLKWCSDDLKFKGDRFGFQVPKQWLETSAAIYKNIGEKISPKPLEYDVECACEY